MEYIAVILFIIILIVGGVAALVWQTKTKGRWGLGLLRGATCPRCGTRMPMFRKPTSADEFMWGGWTCPQCGCKIDKYGREIVPGERP